MVQSRYSSISRVNFYQMAVCSMKVALGRMVGDRLGLGGFSKVVVDRVMYTVRYIVSARKPSLPLPSVVYINTAL